MACIVAVGKQPRKNSIFQKAQTPTWCKFGKAQAAASGMRAQGQAASMALFLVSKRLLIQLRAGTSMKRYVRNESSSVMAMKTKAVSQPMSRSGSGGCR